ncbi:hypothetical protein MMC20_005114 [Loxospora ochrophaea]|nr:hypothetical protein [Loxospora ochrophaea]
MRALAILIPIALFATVESASLLSSKFAAFSSSSKARSASRGFLGNPANGLLQSSLELSLVDISKRTDTTSNPDGDLSNPVTTIKPDQTKSSDSTILKRATAGVRVISECPDGVSDFVRSYCNQDEGRSLETYTIVCQRDGVEVIFAGTCLPHEACSTLGEVHWDPDRDWVVPEAATCVSGFALTRLLVGRQSSPRLKLNLDYQSVLNALATSSTGDNANDKSNNNHQGQGGGGGTTTTSSSSQRNTFLGLQATLMTLNYSSDVVKAESIQIAAESAHELFGAESFTTLDGGLSGCFHCSDLELRPVPVGAEFLDFRIDLENAEQAFFLLSMFMF